MTDGSKIAAIVTVAAFAAIVFFSIIYYKFSGYLTEKWDYLLSKDLSTMVTEFFSSFWIEIILVILIILVFFFFIYFTR